MLKISKGMEKMTLAQSIIKAINQTGCSNYQISQECGSLTQSNLSRWKSGKYQPITLYLRELIEYAEKKGVDTKYIQHSEDVGGSNGV